MQIPSIESTVTISKGVAVRKIVAGLFISLDGVLEWAADGRLL